MTKDELERLDLAKDKIREIRTICDTGEGTNMRDDLLDYFFETTNLMIGTYAIQERTKKGEQNKATFADYAKEQEMLYGLFKKDYYEESYLNPAYAVAHLGQDLGGILSAVYMELMAVIPWSYEGRFDLILIYTELLIELYTILSEDEDASDEELYRAVHHSVVSFYHDYTEVFAADSVKAIILPEAGEYYKKILMESDLSDPKFLYEYGLAVGMNELGLWEYIDRLPEKQVREMARTYVDGYIRGFEISGKDISKKQTVSIDYPIGLERVMRYAVKMFEVEGLKVTIKRDGVISCQGRNRKRGVYTDGVDPQVYYDHRDDRAYYFDRAYVNRTLEVTKNTYETYKKEAAVYGGPAVVEMFGEKKFDPVNKPESAEYTPEQRELLLDLMSESGQISNQYIHEEERSFTIIAYPYPSIGDRFKEIFERTIEVNTLDNEKWEKIQQHLIDALDEGEYVEIHGANENRTDLSVALHPLSDPSKETIFENCTADVNIPVGEVFTSPKLEGTTGTLYVSKVYLNGFEYRDLEVIFKDGMISHIMCSNFPTEEENLRYIDDHILFHHETLPMGEFAIGTNTTAYRMAQDFDIQDRMPILIAEKTGPHFAVGDTCYSEAEDVVMKNSDGKEVVARDNEITLKYRKTEPRKAYFNCHTDITIPYNELKSITVVKKDGGRIDLIRDGFFVLEGTEELNEPLR